MPKKLTFEYVNKFFTEQGCRLLEAEYVGSEVPMSYLCNCGNLALVTWTKFRGGRRCKECGRKKRIASFTGFKHSEETRIKLAERNRLRNQSPEQRRKVSEANKGRVWPLEKRLELSRARQGSGNGFYGKQHTEETRKKLSKSHKGLLAREKHPNWDPNRTEEERQLGRNIEGYPEWRISVFTRDEYTCCVCGGSSGKSLHAHHLESYDINKKLRTEVSNGATTCEECHISFHATFGKGKNTRKQFEEFILMEFDEFRLREEVS